MILVRILKLRLDSNHTNNHNHNTHHNHNQNNTKHQGDASIGSAREPAVAPRGGRVRSVVITSNRKISN